MQAVKGYLTNGRFTPVDRVTLPSHAEVMLVFNGPPHTPTPAPRPLGFLKGKLPPLPDSFFDPLPEEELQAWEQ